MLKLMTVLAAFLQVLVSSVSEALGNEHGTASYILPRKVTGYSDISEGVLVQESIIRAVSNTDIEGTPGFTAVSVLVHTATTVATYTPGSGITPEADTSAYVALSNGVEIGVNEVLDGYTVATAPLDLVVKRLAAAVGAIGENIDTAALVIMEAGGTDLVVSTAVNAGSLVIGKWYIVKTANSANNAAALVGTANATAVVDEVFQAIGDGTDLDDFVVQLAAPFAANAYDAVLDATKALNDAKAPRQGRSLIISTRMERELLSPNSGLVLNTDRGDRILMDGWIGRVGGFDVYVTTLLPSGTNFIALQRRGFAFGYNWKIEPSVNPLFNEFIGDSAVQGRFAYNCGAVRATLIQLNQGVYTTV
jgi:hypothetical protein